MIKCQGNLFISCALELGHFITRKEIIPHIDSVAKVKSLDLVIKQWLHAEYLWAPLRSPFNIFLFLFLLPLPPPQSSFSSSCWCFFFFSFGYKWQSGCEGDYTDGVPFLASHCPQHSLGGSRGEVGGANSLVSLPGPKPKG